MAERYGKITRRSLLQSAALPSVAALVAPAVGLAQSSPPASHPGLDVPVLDQPSLVFGYVGDVQAERVPLSRSGDAWTGGRGAAGLRVEVAVANQQSAISIEAPGMHLQRVHLRWNRAMPEDGLVLGDAWERSYGELAWESLQPERVLPWYALLHASGRTSGIGVKVNPASLAFWQVDPSGISLWLDVRNGGNGVLLGSRTLPAVTIVRCTGEPGESAFAVTQRLCRAMADGVNIPARRGTMPTDVIYGSNDWYYAYGQNTQEGILRDADLVRSVAPAGAVRPFTVIDDGYQDRSRFPSLPRLAAEIRRREVIPGIWIRPLRASASTPGNLLLPAARWSGPSNEQAPPAYDPTVPEALERVAAVAAEACAWGFDLIKHDFTTYELLGQWGSQMGASPTQGNWHFQDRSVTNAEVVRALYQRLRGACGEERIILGCNTVGHLSVGLFDASRTGDDVSGQAWERTRRTGVNTLAYRLPQHTVFYSLDADCVALTPEVPWSMSQQWLRLVADSGSVLLVSPDPRAVGKEQVKALAEAFAICARKSTSEPLDWLASRTPASWRSGGATHQYDWILEEGESPFPIGIQRGPA